jgi:hypothetical protein
VAEYYYEIPDSMLEDWGSKYFVARVRGGHDAMMAGGYLVTLSAVRIWRQDPDGSVKFVKHRYRDHNETKVDLKEFMWIKLSAQDVVR